MYLIGVLNPRLQAKGRIGEVASCDDTASAATDLKWWFWACGHFTVTSRTITGNMINDYINEQEGEPVEGDSRFEIDLS